jgi:hypothetical protein
MSAKDADAGPHPCGFIFNKPPTAEDVERKRS